MVYLYYCKACENGNHKKCELGHPAPKGNYGGSKCRCPCSGDPLYNDPERIRKDTEKFLRQLDKFEKKSRKANLKVK